MSITTNPNDPRLKNIEHSGMQEAYLVLSDKERAKGFVQPFRDTYIHVGRIACKRGKVIKGKIMLCTGKPNHDGDCHIWANPETFKPGCGVATKMGTALSETYARNPKFYGATYCVGCKTHLPVGEYGEFVWEDGTLVGTMGTPSGIEPNTF